METSEGEAIVGLANGMLASLSLNTKSEISGEYQGQEFRMTREAKVTIKRQRAAGAGQKGKGKGKGKGKNRKKAKDA